LLPRHQGKSGRGNGSGLQVCQTSKGLLVWEPSSPHTPPLYNATISTESQAFFCFWHLLRWCIHGWGANLGFCFRDASRLRDGERQEELPRLYFASNWYSARPGGDGAAELAVLDSGPSGGWRGLWTTARHCCTSHLRTNRFPLSILATHAYGDLREEAEGGLHGAGFC